MAVESGRKRRRPRVPRIALVRAHPDQDRQLADAGPLLFWRTGPGGTRDGMVAAVSFCANPACPCREAQVLLTGATDNLDRVEELADGRIRCYYENEVAGAKAGPRRPRADVMFDLDTGTIEPISARSSDGGLVAWFREVAKDPEVVQLLQRRLVKARGPAPPPPDLDPRDWKPGDMLSYGEVFSDVPDDSFEHDGRWFDVVDLHCVEPDCDCDEAVLLFMEIPPDAPPDKAVDLGAVHVEVSTGKSTEFQPDDEADPRMLQRAWDAFSATHRTVNWLGDRRRRLREVGPEIRRRWDERHAAKPSPAVGRNDPCPCGSGRKYKKCCGK